MAALNEAWHTLSDPGRRSQYDASLQVASRSARPAGPSAVDEVDDWVGLAGPTASPPRWPAAAIMLIGAMAVIFVFTAYALSSSNGSTLLSGNEPVAVGSCVVIRPKASAVVVPCQGPHYGMVRAVVTRGERCPLGTEGYFDRNAPEQVCVHPG